MIELNEKQLNEIISLQSAFTTLPKKPKHGFLTERGFGKPEMTKKINLLLSIHPMMLEGLTLSSSELKRMRRDLKSTHDDKVAINIALKIKKKAKGIL